MPSTFDFDDRNLPVDENENGEVVVSVKNVSKKFCKNLRRSLSYGIIELSKNLAGIKPDSTELRKDEFWALDNISFELKRGEILGLIGLNGSGKSTLLRLLAGIFPPDKGEIAIKGKLGALIAVGAGFHPHMTGRENIYLNGIILGMSREEIHTKFEEIAKFAEIGEFLDAPVATYSSGMRVRLGFSIAVHIDPDVTLIDEVLAVGDFNFRQKCSQKMNEIRSRTAAILVSHNMRDILMLCFRTIVLVKGKIAFAGPSAEAVEFYLNAPGGHGFEAAGNLTGNNSSVQIQAGDSIYGEIYRNSKKISDIYHQWRDGNGNPAEFIEHGAAVFHEFSFRLLQPVNKLVLGVPIYDQKGMLMTGISTDMEEFKINVQSDGRVSGRLKIERLCLNPGHYISFLSVMDNKEFIYRNVAGRFTVIEMPFYFGVMTPEYSWHFDERS